MIIKVINKEFKSMSAGGKRKACCLIQYQYPTKYGMNIDTAWIGYFIYPAGKIKTGEFYQITILDNRVKDFRPVNTEMLNEMEEAK